MLAPKLNAGVGCSAGFEAPVKLNADVVVLLAAPKIDVLPSVVVVVAAWPNVPNVAGLSAAVDPKLGITLAPAAG